MAELLPRISGTEVEYAIFSRYTTQAFHVPFTLMTGFIFNNHDPAIKISEGMLSNGARYYPDGHLLEYATPEETSFRGTAIRELAGERIVMDSMTRYITGHSTMASALVRKRAISEVPDNDGSSCGYHASLLADRRALGTLDDGTAELLGLHLATSLHLLGSGAIYLPKTPYAKYSYGQKTLDLGLDYDLSTNVAGKKPLINLRDEPLSDLPDSRRIHITSLDPHISPWAIEMTLGTCSLVLRAIEQGYGRDLTQVVAGGTTLVSLSRRTSLHPTHNIQTEVFDKGDRKSITTNDIQERIIEIVSQTDHTDEEHRILEEWQQAHHDYLLDPMSIADRSDAISRLAMIRVWNAAKGLEPDDMTSQIAFAADSIYDRVFEIGTTRAPKGTDPTDAYHKTVTHKWRSSTFSNTMPTEQEIQDAYHNPPTTTRAYGRGRAILSGGTDVSRAQWDGYLYNGQKIQTQDPYEPDARMTSPTVPLQLARGEDND
ncbi:MAG: proteasome accessory factor PafA2 family protein [Candidatus Saccharimonas sp.]